MKINPVVRWYTAYQWTCPGCGVEVEKGNEPRLESDMLCEACDEKRYKEELEQARRQFDEEWSPVCGMVVSAVFPVEEELIQWMHPGVESVVIMGEGGVYKITADGPLYINEVESTNDKPA